MAPPPFVDLFDWRVPYVELLAMICVSRVYDRDAFGDGLRAPPRTGRFSPAARANGVARSATSTAATTIQGPLPRKGRRLRMRVSIGGRPPWVDRWGAAGVRGADPWRPSAASGPATPPHLKRLRSCKAAVIPPLSHAEQRPPARHVAQPDGC